MGLKFSHSSHFPLPFTAQELKLEKASTAISYCSCILYLLIHHVQTRNVRHPLLHRLQWLTLSILVLATSTVVAGYVKTLMHTLRL